MDNLLVFQADENADSVDWLKCRIEPEEATDEEVSDEAVKILRQRKDFLQPLAERVLALVG
jgi:hypothetical protein